MKDKIHSTLAPSSSKIWCHCGFGSKFLAAKSEDETNEASEFGTETHLLAENYIRQSLKLEDFNSSEVVNIDDLKKSLKHYSEEMENLASGYANYVIETAEYENRRTGVKPIVLVEQTFDMDYAPNTHGTLDVGIIAGDTLTIIDNKTGFIKVLIKDEDGELNSQLAIYGLYAYKCFKDIYPIKNIRLIIYQNRIGNISESMLSVDELLKWEKEVLIPSAKEALSDNPKAISGSHCKYCPGRSVCKTRSKEALSVVKDMKKPELMTDAEIEVILPKIDSIIDYCNDIKEYCLKKSIEQGKKWQGYKLVLSNTKRKINDEDAVGKILHSAGYEPFIPNKLKSITELQKLIGKTKLTDLVGDYIVKPIGEPVLAPDSDAREEIVIKNGLKEGNI